MIEIKCATCGNTFQVPDERSGMDAQCPGCGAMTLVPTVSTPEPEAAQPEALEPKALEPKAPEPETLETEAPKEEAPVAEPPAEVAQKPQRFLSPLELALILAILGIVVALVIYRVVNEEPPAPVPLSEEEVHRQIIEREKQLAQECFNRMEKIAGALKNYQEKHKALPPDLDALKEAGVLGADVRLFCPKTKSRYMYFAREAVAAQGVVEDPVLVADPERAHLDSRIVIRLSGAVEWRKEDVVREILAAQRKEFEKLDAAKTKAALERMKRERDAGDLMVAAATSIQTGKPAEAIKIYQKLLDDYADTEVVEKSKVEIEVKVKSIVFNVDLEEVRKLVQQLRLDEARSAYAKLARDATKDQKKVVESELENIKQIEKGTTLYFFGDLDGALELYNELGSTTADPFWKKMAHELAMDVQKYRQDAAALFKSAQAAEEKDLKVRALSLYMSVRDSYPHSAQAPKAPPKIAELVSEVPYRERFLPKDKLLDAKTAKAIRNGLVYLALKQQPDGSWKSRSTGIRALDDVALTGLVMLCFLAEGSTHLSGDYRVFVAKALERLKAVQKKSGLVGDTKKPNYRMSHALALLALCELRNMTDDDELTSACKRAVYFAIKLQEMGMGWRLAEQKAPEDIMLTTWMQLGMLSAASGEIEFLPGLLEGAGNTYNASSNSEGRVHYEGLEDSTQPRRRLPRYQASLIATAAAAYGKLATGADTGTTRLKGAISFLNENLPSQSMANFPYFFFGTYAVWQVEELTFRQWNWALKAALLPTQLTEGKDAGAWDMGRYSNFRGGKIYPTALALLSLQAPYNHFACVDRRAEAKKPGPKGPEVTLVFKEDGSELTGTLVSETDEEITIEIVRGSGSVRMIYKKEEIEKIIPR